MTTMARTNPAGREPAPEPVQDDPLVELARIVSGRSSPEEPRRRPFLDESPGMSEADLARDLEAELLCDLQATFAAAGSAGEDDVLDESPLYSDEDLGDETSNPFPFEQSPSSDSEPYAGDRDDRSNFDLEETVDENEEPEPLPPPEAPRALRPRVLSALGLRGHRTGPAFNPDALAPTPLDEQDVSTAVEQPPSGWAATAEEGVDSNDQTSFADEEAWDGEPDPGLAQPTFDDLDPHYADTLMAEGLDGGDGAETPPPHVRHRDPRLDSDPFGEARRAGRPTGRRFYSFVGVLALATVVVAAILVVTGGDTANDEPPLIAAEAAQVRVFPEAETPDAAGNVVFDRVNPGENGTPEENLLAGAEPVADIGATPEANDGITEILKPAAGDPVFDGGASPRLVRTVTVLRDGTIVYNDAALADGETPLADPAIADDPAAAAEPVAVAPIAADPVIAAPIAEPPIVAAQIDAPIPVVVETVGANDPNVPNAGDPIAPGFYVQVSAQGTEEAAQAQLADFRSLAPSLLGARQAVIQRADLPQGVFFRVQFGPSSTQAEAEQLRQSLNTAGIDAFVTTN